SGRHADAAPEVRLVNEVVEQQRAVLTVEDLHVRAAALAGADDQVAAAVAVHVAAGHVDAPGEGGVERHDAGDRTVDQLAGGAAENLDMWAAARAGADDDIGDAV